MRTFTVLLISLFFFCSCGESGLTNTGGYDPVPTYNLRIDRGDPSSNQQFSGVETEWNRSTGIVVLGPEDTGEPLARLELHLIKLADDENAVDIEKAILSTTDVRTGTADELNAKLYTKQYSQTWFADQINDKNIKITTESGIVLKRVIVNENDVPESITVYVTFNAVD